MHQTLGFRKDLKNEKSKKIQSSSEKKTQKSEEIGTSESRRKRVQKSEFFLSYQKIWPPC